MTTQIQRTPGPVSYEPESCELLVRMPQGTIWLNNVPSDVAAYIVTACNAHDALVQILGKILRAHDSGNNGAYMGEAKLCRAFEREAMEALVAAGAESELMGGSLGARAALAKVTS